MGHVRGRREQRKGIRGLCIQSAGMGLLLTMVLFLLPGLLVSRLESQGEQHQTMEPLQPSTEGVGERDTSRVVLLARQDGGVEELTMKDYLWGVVAAEMPARFELEALKAQAAAARTYTVRLQGSSKPKHGGAHLCDDSNCCQAYIDQADAHTRWGLQAEELSEKIAQAVSETDGLGILYQGAPIQAVFFSSAAGRTVDAVEVWGNSVAYLQSVDSPEGEEVPNWRSQVVLSAEEVRQLVLAQYPGADLTAAPEAWLSQPEYSASGCVLDMTVGGVALTGAQVRSLFSLRSSNFTVSCQNDTFTFDVTGYGHGVGMSQYGANAMASSGSDFKSILTWYYTGTEVAYLW